MNIVVKEELKAYIDPLTPDEHEALERSLLAEGCRDALVLWGDVLVDGHNRYGICQKHGLPFQTVQNPRFQSMQDVHLWMIEQHLGRRSVSDFQRGVLALRKREILAARQRSQRDADAAAAAEAPAVADDQPDTGLDQSSAHTADDSDSPPWEETSSPVSRAELAREARLSSNQVVMIERIHKQAAPEVVQAVKAGEISISAAAAVATLSEDEQRAAAQAGKAELKQAAKRVRDAKRKPKADEAEGGEAERRDIKALQRRVTELENENAALQSKVTALQAQLERLRG
ncbi:plasmid replication/partition related protein [Xanthomonas citri pv. fuscans CFBP 6996]|uniref:plasmid replication/partition related protein n=1 Tax=Xanthomonas citri TaxID=346 RepID=UPI000C187DC7|nr:plasmid replication/partition related protein [Xanthomonas citri]ATS52123.1 plasmid replication/partition related protein [Xanthomonas citri pv. phaseoli var. fuscans]ATS53955.1 plasmid replication/partition related protein [Xanthomonas citri pv. phaseoli var. fuscans]ATS58250.1 plasmid replication/partition related protein [Xanthomonas citri pv. phaseoli var. fuscans]PTY29643.1 plasmid replication/partition related protein [Xanthomonas citri pv. fuscans CFBP 6996]QWN16723.1 plasmid replica